MAKYGLPFWWTKNNLKKWLQASPLKDKKQAVIQWISEYTKAILEDVGEDEERVNVINMLRSALYRDLITHESIRLYIQDIELIDFLKSTSCPQIGATKEAMNNFIEKYGNVVHLLTPDKEVATFVVDVDMKDEDMSIMAVILQNDITQFAVKDGEGTFTDAIRAQFKRRGVPVEGRAKKLLDAGEIMVNLLYYIATFPDALIDGAPTDKGGIQLLPKSNHSVVIKTHPDIVEPRVPGSRATHFRHGHYRFLKSERFTHMQGKFVFVRGSIVHGSTAKTVIG